MILTFNAKTVSCEILEKTLVGRKEVVDRLYQELYEKSANEETYQSLLIAPRGSGKTHLTKVIYCRLKKAGELQDKIVIAYMVEDEYGVVNFLHFCLRSLIAIDRYKELPKANIKSRIQEISLLPSKEQETAISSYLRSLLGNKKLIVLVENLDTLLKGMKDNGASLRDFMHEYNKISLVATAQTLTKQFNNDSYPFYNFFKTRHLQKLSFEESFELIKALIGVEENEAIKKNLQASIAENNEVKSKIQAIYELTCGNHRLLVHFYGFLKADLKSDLSKVFVKQMNDLKTYYEQFLNNLSVQQQRIVQLLSLNHSPLQGKQIAQQSFLESNVVSKQLSQLYKLGFIDKHKVGKNVFYEIREPLMRICFEINENPDGSAKLFVDFLKIIYSEADRKKNYLKYKLSAKHVLAGMKEQYISEADIYERTFSAAGKSDLIRIEESLKKYSLDDLEAMIDKELRGNVKATDGKLDEILSEAIKYFNENKFDLAIEAALKGGEIDPLNEIIYMLLGFSYYVKADYDKAINAYKKVIELNPKYAGAYNNLGIVMRAKGDLNSAIIQYQKAIELNPKYAGAYNNLGIAMRAKGDLNSAIIQYQKAIELNPKRATTYNNLSGAMFYKGELDGAIIQSQKAIELNPKYTEAYNNLGIAMKAKGDLDGAIVQYQKAIKINSKYEIIYNNLGNAMKAKGDLGSAIIQFQKAIELNPKYATAFNNLGAAKKAKGDIDGAIIQYQKAMELNPKDTMAYNSISLLYLELNNWKKSHEAIQKALDFAPESSYTLGTSIQVHLYQNDWKSAEKSLTTIIANNLVYNAEMVAEDILVALSRWAPEQLMLERFKAVENYFISQEKAQLFYESFTFATFDMLISIEKYSLERLQTIQYIYDHFSQKIDAVKIPHLLLKVGIDYLKNKNKEAIYYLSKEERQVFENQVLSKRK